MMSMNTGTEYMREQNPKFSIVIPVYNAEKFINECIVSILNQTYRDFEVLLINDGSTDDSGAICDDWTSKDDRVRVIHKSNAGSSSARNVGIERAKGDYITFLDSDDYWNTDHDLAKVAQRIESTKPDVLILNYRKVYQHKKEMPYFRGTTTFKETLSEEATALEIGRYGLWTACAWNKVVNRKLFDGERLQFRVGVTAEDIEWSFRLAMIADTFDYLDLCMINYRQREGSVSAVCSPKTARCIYDNIKYCMQLYHEDSWKNPILEPFLAYQYATLLYNISTLSDCEEYKELSKAAKEMRWLLRWSNTLKTRIIQMTNQLTGFSTTIKLLRWKTKLDKNRGRCR